MKESFKSEPLVWTRGFVNIQKPNRLLDHSTRGIACLQFLLLFREETSPSYLNYITNPRRDSDKCFITGNPKPRPPRRWLGNELYTYTRYIK
uniref:Uncharacterized protein n=1 Tax=viral metagenome TaxID=1070528 RepID=A0A6C0JZ74_9ZZZZ